MYVNQQGYLERKLGTKLARGGNKSPKRNWWLVKYNHKVGTIYIPASFIGKRVRVKMIIEEVK